MRPRLDRNHSANFLSFLEPPHIHDPTDIPRITSLPPSTLAALPQSVQGALSTLQESTSVAFASYSRLQDLLDERFARLLPSATTHGRFEFSENAYFNYTNSLSAERSYLLSDALPEWRHKANMTRLCLRAYEGTPVAASSGDMTILEWWSELQSTVSSWLQEATQLRMPSFEETVEEYIHSGPSSSASTPTNTPTREEDARLGRQLPAMVNTEYRDFAFSADSPGA